jgi:hypothetical protein
MERCKDGEEGVLIRKVEERCDVERGRGEGGRTG